MTKEQFLARCPTIRATYKTQEGLSCFAEVISINQVHAAFDDYRDSDTTCTCGRNCATRVGDGVTYFCENPECKEFHVEFTVSK